MKFETKLIIHSAVAVLVVVLATTAAFASRALFERINVSFIGVIFGCGMGGGIVANYLRLRGLTPMTVRADTSEAMRAIVQVYAGPLVAGVFGVLTYCLFMSGLLQGALFPKFVGTEAEFNRHDILSFFVSMYPELNRDGILALVWAFVAGFSEKMIPNILDRLADRTSDDTDPAARSTPTASRPAEQDPTN